jgi:hypothetical protein
MAGLIDVGILKPELAGSFAAGYRGAEQGRQQAAQAEQQLASGRQKLQMDEMTMQRLREDRAALTDLQAKLRAAGQSDDPQVFFKALIQTGNPDYMAKGYEGLQRYQDQLEYDRVVGGRTPQTAPTTAPGTMVAPAAPSGELVAAPITPPTGVMREIAPGGAMGAEMPLTRGASANALAPSAPAAPAPTNAMIAGAAPVAPVAAAPAGTNPALVAETQTRINSLLEFAGRSRNQQMATNALSQAKILQDQLQLYSKRGPNEPAALQELRAYMGMSPEEKAVFEKLQKIKSPTVSASATAAGTPTAKSLAGPVGARAETSLAKAEGASGIMESANMVRDALNTGNVIAGPLAGVRTKFAQVLELAGAGDKEKLVNTRTAIQGLATLTLESRAELKGQGQVTENEQKLLERARSGNIEDMTIAELQSIVNVSQRLAGRLWSSHENLLKTMETDPAAADSLRYYKPTMSLPKAVGEGRPKAEVDKRQQGLADIFGGKK